MRGDKIEEGYGILISFIIILIFSALLLSLLPLIKAGSKNSDSADELEVHSRLMRIAEDIITEIILDETPYSDSTDDPVWETIGIIEEDENIEIELSDISSRLNLNIIRNEIIDETGLSRLIFKPQDGMGQIEQHKADVGFIINPEEEFPDLFKEKTVGDYITTHGFWNMNISDEASLLMVYKKHIRNEAKAEIFRHRIQELRINLDSVGNNDLQDFLQAEFEVLYPLVSTVPVMNIQFIPREVLWEILNHDFGSRPLPDPSSSYYKIINSRDFRRFTSEELLSILKIEDFSHPIYDYLGVKTWFWKLAIESEKGLLSIIILERPNPGKSYKPDGDETPGASEPRNMQIIENRFIFNGNNQ